MCRGAETGDGRRPRATRKDRAITAGDKAEKLKGKETAGDVTGNKDLKREGQMDKASGATKEQVSKGKKKLQDTFSDDKD